MVALLGLGYFYIVREDYQKNYTYPCIEEYFEPLPCV